VNLTISLSICHHHFTSTLKQAQVVAAQERQASMLREKVERLRKDQSEALAARMAAERRKNLNVVEARKKVRSIE
jgi:hypothetical protein